MKKFTQNLNSPKKIAAFVVCVVLIAGAIGFATLQVGANVNANKTIGMDKGVAVALADAGFKAEEVSNLTAHYDDEDGVAAYDIDFTVNGYEYEYTIKASDGKIIEAQREKIKTVDTEGKTDASTSATPSSGSSEVTGTSSASGASQNTSSSTDNPSSKYIGVDKAKSIALKDAGVSASSVTFTKAKLDKDDGMTVYEIEFYSGDTEYEYEIDATSGAIRDRDSEHRDYDDDDDWDDDDDDDHDDDDEWDD